MQNTAFCIFSPDGKERLSQSGRGLTRDVRGAEGLDLMALQFRRKGELSDAIVPDFASFRMALNIAAADSRVLVLVAAPNSRIAESEKRLRSVAWHDDIVGRFHFDFEHDFSSFAKPLGIAGEVKPGVYLIRPDPFGVKGEVMQRLSLDVTNEKLTAAMKAANTLYAKTTERKTYQQHVAKGQREGYFFEMPMPFGEDRNGDGAPDSSRRYDSAKQRSKRSGNYFPASGG